jgi:hypothetical protein
MQISVRRSGGYAGLEEAWSVDTASLEPDLRAKLEASVSDARFFEQPTFLAGDVGSDAFRCEITVKDGDRAHTVTFSDPGDLASPLGNVVRLASQAR